MCARTRYGKGVSPFFKRKKSQQSASHVPEPELARSVQSAQSAPSPDEVAVESADDVVQPDPIAASDPQTREQLLDEAFARWHAELAVRAQKADETTSQAASGIIDLTHPHPTGSVAFSAGSPVRITSLVREHFAQQRAVNNLRNLQATTQRIAEMYGHAPVSLAVGRLTWTELPSAPASVAPTNVEFAELTGEFRIDENGSLVAVDSAKPSDEIRESNAYDADEGNAGQEKDGAGREGGELGGGEPAPGASEATPRVAQIVREAALFRSIAIEFEEGDATVQQLGHTDINSVFVRALRENGATAEQLAQLNNAVATTTDLDYLLELCANPREAWPWTLPAVPCPEPASCTGAAPTSSSRDRGTRATLSKLSRSQDSSEMSRKYAARKCRVNPRCRLARQSVRTTRPRS